MASSEADRELARRALEICAWRRRRRTLRELVEDRLEQCVDTGAVRSGTTTSELATYWLHALPAVSHLPSKTAVRTLVAVTFARLAAPA